MNHALDTRECLALSDFVRAVLRPFLMRIAPFMDWSRKPLYAHEPPLTIIGYELRQHVTAYPHHRMTIRLNQRMRRFEMVLYKPHDAIRLHYVQSAGADRPRIFMETETLAVPVAAATPTRVTLHINSALRTATDERIFREVASAYFAPELFLAHLTRALRTAHSRYPPSLGPIHYGKTAMRLRGHRSTVEFDIAPVRNRYYFAVRDLRVQGPPAFREEARQALDGLCAPAMADDGLTLRVDALPLRSLVGIQDAAVALAELDYAL